MSLLFVACQPKPTDVIEASHPLVIYPDYHDIVIPCNIAPLNFVVRGDSVDGVEVTVTPRHAGGTLAIRQCSADRRVMFDVDQWHRLLDASRADTLDVVLTVREAGRWLRHEPLHWVVSPDSIDAYITYRLIEPGFEVWGELQIEERCLESFEKRYLAQNRDLGRQCMNCHVHGGPRGENSFFHLRGTNGGTILSRDGKLSKLTLKAPGMQYGAVYGDLHPSGRYGVFSSNFIIPTFHSHDQRRLEVYDTTSGLHVADFDGRRMTTLCGDSLTPALTDSLLLVTFPSFSADGKSIYFCAASMPQGGADSLIHTIGQLQYSLCRIGFDASSGTFGHRIDTLYDAQRQGGSVSFPKCSPDGRYLLFTQSAYGTFPIWHREARLQLMQADTLVDSATSAIGYAATYHSWSHNSRWVAFASKRIDGQYGRVHFAHVSPEGMSRPFILPQADPLHDDFYLKSYNIPDLADVPASFSERDVKRLYDEVPAEAFDRY